MKTTREVREESAEVCRSISAMAKAADRANTSGDAEGVYDLLYAIRRLADYYAGEMEGEL